MRLNIKKICAALLCTAVLASTTLHTSGAAKLPDPAKEMMSLAPAGATDQTIVLAGGCFWGIEGVFQHVKGVKEAISGYAGGSADKADYDAVSTGTTGHAESVKIIYDPSQVSLGSLLKVYFSVAHDPTELNRQGPDSGSQYRSEIFYTSPEQAEIAKTYIAQLDAAKVFSDPIVTKLEPLKAFYEAEDYHQNYMALHPMQPYIAMHDVPKVKNLKSEFPDLYIDTK